MVLGVGWQDCQSSPTHTLHPWLNPEWKKHSRGHSPLHDCAEGSRTSHSRPFLLLFIHGQKWSCFSSRGASTVCSFLTVCSHPRTGILLFWGSHSELGIVCFSSTVFPGKGHSGGQSCVCFSLPISGLNICCLCPAVKLVFLSILGLCKFLDDSTV